MVFGPWQRGQTNPFRRLRRQLFPFLSPVGRGWIPGRTLSVAYGDSCSPFCRLSATSSPRPGEVFRGGEPLAKRAGFVLIGQWQKKPAYKRKTLRPCQSLSLSGEVARRSRDGEGCFQDEPSQSPTATALPKGEPLAKRAGFVLIGQWQKKPAYKRKTLRPCQSLSLSGEVARRSRDGEG